MLGISCPKLSPQNQLKIYFVTSKQHTLGIDKLKNVFRSFLTRSKKLLQNFKIFLFSRIFYWVTHSLPYWCLQTSVYNLIITITKASISSLFNVASSGDMPFHQPQQLQCLHHGSTKAHFFSFVLLSFLPYHIGDNWRYMHYGFGARFKQEYLQKTWIV